MPSPFPGMDPYLEDPAYWSDFHASFLLYLRDVLLERLPPQYEVRLDEKVNLVEISPDRIEFIEPDLALSRDRPSAPSNGPAAGVATLEPITIPHLFIEEEQRQRWIEILHRPERSLVTVLELLSPANKEEPGLHRYRDKRFDLLMREVHLVEIDLLLSGQRLRLRDPLPPADYYVLVSGAPINGPSGTPCDLTQLKDLNLVIPSERHLLGTHIRERIASGRLQPHRVMVTDGMVATLESVKHSEWGALCLMNSVADKLGADDTYIYPVVNPTIPFDLYLVHDLRKPPTAAARLFVEMFEQQLKEVRTQWSQTIKF